MNIDIAMVNKFYDLAVMQPTVPDSLRSHYALLEHCASECVGCQSCEARCPFSLFYTVRLCPHYTRHEEGKCQAHDGIYPLCARRIGGDLATKNLRCGQGCGQTKRILKSHNFLTAKLAKFL